MHERTGAARPPGARPDPHRRPPMLLYLALAVFALWLLGVVVFKVTAAVVHLALFVAVLALVAHFVRRRVPRV